MDTELDIRLDDQTGLPFIDQGGHRRFLASLPATRKYNFPAFRDSFQTIPRSDWHEKDLSPFSPHVFDQDGKGACVAHGAVAGLEIAIEMSGRTCPQLCPWFVYPQIDGGVDAGAVVEDSLTELKSKGACLYSSVPYGAVRLSEVPQAAYTEALRFRVDEAYAVDSFDQGVSGILQNFPWVFGIEIGQAFDPAPGSGIIPDLRGSGGGHCMCGVGVKQIGGKWYVKVKNSWGVSWGLGGYCYMPESYFTGQGGHYVIVAAIDDPQDPSNPPAANA